MEVVLVQPQIPQNTGSIARSCAATNCRLHLIAPLGFEIDEKRVRRAGLDYWPFVSLHQHSSWQTYQTCTRSTKFWCFSTHANRSYFEADFSGNDALIFGSETKGLGHDFMSQFPEDCILKIPMLSENVRSLNLSNAVSIVLYHALNVSGLIGGTAQI